MTMHSFNIPTDHPRSKTFVIGPNSYATTTSGVSILAHEVTLPECSMVYIWAVGGGSGGTSVTANTVGAGGGGSGAMSSVIVPRFFLPNKVYVQAGLGGAGAPVATGSGDSYGGSTYVSVLPGTGSTVPTALNTILIANGGTPGVPGVGGAASTGATMILGAGYSAGMFGSIAGQNGASSAAASSPGTAITYPTTGLVISGGASGGGQGNTAGGAITMPSGSPFTSITAASPGADGTNGFSCFNELSQYTTYIGNTSLLNKNNYRPAFTAGIGSGPIMFLSCGGGGGGGRSSGTGTTGGAGGIGSGGGGGGGSTSGNTGAGGPGGHGLCIIVCW